MKKTRRIALLGASLAVALGSGYAMQSRSSEQRAEAKTDAPQAITELAAATAPVRFAPPPAPVAMPVSVVTTEDAPVEAATPVALDSLVLPPLPPTSALPEPAPAPQPAPVAVADPCPVTFIATPAADAMIDVTLLAACAPSQRVVLRHGGLVFTARTSATGAIFATLPAMDTEGRVILRFEDGQTVAAATRTDLGGIRRFAVQWVGNDAFQIQAYENGATFGAPGHVSAAAPHLPAPGLPPTGGYLTQLGDASVSPPMLAEVYTWPTNTSVPVELTVEAAVTDATCNRELLGETLESRNGTLSSDEITLSMPTCDAVGDFLVLNNLTPGTKLASAN